MNAGLEFLGWSVLFALALLVWGCYELRQFHRRYTRRHVLKSPRPECETDRQIWAWMGKR